MYMYSFRLKKKKKAVSGAKIIYNSCKINLNRQQRKIKFSLGKELGS